MTEHEINLYIYHSFKYFESTLEADSTISI